MCQSMVNIQSPTAEIRRGKKKKKEGKRRTNHSMKIYMVSLFHRATINNTGTKWHNTPKSKENLNVNQQSSLRTAHVSAYHCAQLSYTNRTQNSSDNLPPYPRDTHHCLPIIKALWNFLDICVTLRGTFVHDAVTHIMHKILSEHYKSQCTVYKNVHNHNHCEHLCIHYAPTVSYKILN